MEVASFCIHVAQLTKKRCPASCFSSTRASNDPNARLVLAASTGSGESGVGPKRDYVPLISAFLCPSVTLFSNTREEKEAGALGSICCIKRRSRPICNWAARAQAICVPGMAEIARIGSLGVYSGLGLVNRQPWFCRCSCAISLAQLPNGKKILFSTQLKFRLVHSKIYILSPFALWLFLVKIYLNFKGCRLQIRTWFIPSKTYFFKDLLKITQRLL